MRNLILSSRRREKIVGLSLALSVFAGSAAALAVNPQDNVRGFYDTLLTTMRYGPTLGQSGRYARLAPVVDRLFDLPAMTQLAVGPTWATLSPAQQQQLIEAFRHYIAATYADRFRQLFGCSSCRSPANGPTTGMSLSKPRLSNPMETSPTSTI